MRTAVVIAPGYIFSSASTYSFSSVMRIGVVGGPADVIARLEPLVAAGAQHLSFGPPLGPEPLQAVTLLGQVIDHFR